MITPEMFAFPGEVFITNAVIYLDGNDTIEACEAYELRCVAQHTGYISLRFQYENIVGSDKIMTSEEFGIYCLGFPVGHAIGVAVYGIPKS